MRIGIDRLTVAIDDKIATNFEFNSAGPFLQTTAVASDRALEPGAVDPDRGAIDEIGVRCLYSRYRYARRLPPPIVIFNRDDVHDESVFQTLALNRTGKLHPKILRYVFV